MCDICQDVLNLLQNYENDIKDIKCCRLLEKNEVTVLCIYVQGWNQRQCTCCYKDPKNFDRFNDVIQGLILTVLDLLRGLHSSLSPEKSKSHESKDAKKDEEITVCDATDGAKPDVPCTVKKRTNWDDWTVDEKEKLLHLMSKVFISNFPVYIAFKHSVHSKLEEFTQEEIVMLSSFCDVNDLDSPIYLLRNACFFCKHEGLKLFRNCFHDADLCALPLALSHAMTAIISNLKAWMSMGATVHHLVPLRSSLIRYLCRVSDKDLRMTGNRNMFEYMWSAIKDPLDAHARFDKEGLDLALKYFCSSTLTMRLSGVTQINSHINMYNELCHNETLVDTELGNLLANWLMENRIVEYIFGPNLHVEIIKQSHVILNYLAMEGRITNEHIDAIWSACQLKHCSKQVLDLLPPLIKNLEVGPVRYLYRLLNDLEPKDHTEQTLLLASALIKFIWTSGGSAACIGEPVTNASPFSALMKRSHIDQRISCKEEASSSERSVSVEASNSEDEDEPSDAQHPQTNSEVDSSQVSDRPRSSGEGSEPAPASQTSSPCSERFYKEHGEQRLSRPILRSSLKKDLERASSSDETDFSTDSHNESLCRGRLKRSLPCYDRALVEEVSEDSPEEKLPHIVRRKLLRRKRPRIVKKSMCRLRRDVDDVEEFSEDSIDKMRKRIRPAISPQPLVIKDVSDERRTESDDDKNKGAEVEGTKEQGHILPALVKVVLEREGAGLCFEEECPHYLAGLHSQRHADPDDGSCNSSHVSNKSEKNMADFDGEESCCEDELAHLAVHPMTQRLANIACMYPSNLQGVKTFHHIRGREEEYFDVESICKPGQTLLWDLVQDDRIGLLGEGLSVEAEKILCNLVCWATHKMIRMKFIEGCLDNLASNRSVLVSLRILPKLLGSFQQFRENTDTHSVTMWAEKEHKMMKHFFTNLVAYTSQRKENISQSLYTHTEEIQVRLHFLFCVFSAAGSPDGFRLSKEQVDTLWSCLAMDKECRDELFSWLLNQAKSQDQHALNLDLFKHILLQKMPQLPPETTSMTALSLLQQLSSLARLATASFDTPSSEADVCGIQQLWGIALKALNTDVSMAAIQNLNNYYINVHHGTLEKEEDFIQQCMDSLLKASQDIHEAEESNLMIIQRALLLLTTHIETFHRRYAYHLRRWHLSKESMARHMAGVAEKQGSALRIICQPAGMSDKTTLELYSTDYIADLRAEVTCWWENLRKRNKQHQEEAETSGSTLVPILGTLLTDGPIRMISQGQELTCDLDESSLGEMGFKDLQLVFVSVGAARPGRRREVLESSVLPMSVLPAPPRERLPTVLLLQAPYFEMLFSLMQQLGSLKAANKAGDPVPHTKAQVLSRRVWEVLMILPTSPTMLQGLKDIPKDSSTDGNNYTVTLQTLLNPAIPQKLMYSMQIVEAFHLQGQKDKSNQASKTSEKNNVNDEMMAGEEVSWTQKFIERGGLRHLFDIFMSGVLQSRDGEDWNEWNQDCLASLLKLIYQFGQRQGSADDSCVADSGETPRKRAKRMQKGSADKLIVPKLNKTMLQMMSQVEAVLKVLMTILYEAALPCDPNQYKTGFWGRAQVVHYTITLLVSWAFSEPLLNTCLFQYPGLDTWLKRLVLDDPEPSVRREACTGLYRLCLGTTIDGKTGHHFIAPLLSSCLQFLSVAQSMKPPRPDEEEKEPYGPGCKDYFWLVCRLVDSIDEELLQKHDPDQKSLLNLDNLARYVAEAIVTRDYREVRHTQCEDDGLHGLLTLASVVMKHSPPFKFSKEGRDFLSSMFDCLFALPNPKRRYLPKCKSHPVRAAAFDMLVELVKGCKDNYQFLHAKLLQQHSPESHAPYLWDYWPHEDGRSECGYVGLTNLGATCYLASCMQHLYMMPQARASILSAKNISESKHENTLCELQRMFAYLMESERKAYNPRSFCKVYTMDHQPLNTGEQKDMAEFFTDLISKLEEMTPQLKSLVKNLFCGTISNNVVSLDCPHISRTIEEFYTLRCQVADMRNLYESLDELTVKDTLEGDNMYTCSQCGKKVRAEKRACIKNLPHILCFNTMRYTFNMVTMLKEKVNTHFSFPLRLDMAQYMEKNLMPDQHKEIEKDDDECYEYDLIGVTVHTGTADGGHYYSFIRERQNPTKDKWFLFNDAEVKLFDPTHIAAECFGGEMTSKTYDSVTDKFLDFSFEKTNSAYMLFYERINPKDAIALLPGQAAGSADVNQENIPPFELSHELAEWIWKDNMQFLQDRSVFEHTYFNFMWQICGYIPQTLNNCPDITLLSAKLGTSFVLETLIHAKEKPTIAQWIELLTKQFNASQSACEWFLDHMADNDWWPIQILLKCPNQVVRQLFQRLCIHVINQLKPVHSSLYLQPYPDSDDSSDVDMNQIGQYSCVTRFIKRLLMLVEHGAKQHLKHLTEYFAFLLEFAKMGDEECQFLLSVEAITTIINFYLGQKASEYVEVTSDDEDEEDDDADNKYKPASLERMITLVALLVEKSRGEDHKLHLSQSDYTVVSGGKGFPFLYQQIKDNINPRQTCNLIFSLCRWNEHLALHLVNMFVSAIAKHQESSGPFFKMLSLLVEFVGGPPGMPPFTTLILQRIWDTADYCALQCLEWLIGQVPRNKLAHTWVLQSMDNWVERFLIAHHIQRVRYVAAVLLVSLVPSNHFRQVFRSARSLLPPQKDIPMSSDALTILHRIYDLLLNLFKRAKLYVDPGVHGTAKLMSYFAVITYCLVSKTEKLMFSPHFLELWNLFQPKLSEPAIPVHHNKQALLIFWYQVCVDCPENIKLIVQNSHVTKNIAFNYILADHDDQEVVVFNRCMLPAYYGLLRLCCQQSRPFTRQLASHQNIQWAFKNITPYTTQYTAAINELFKLMRLFVAKFPDSTEQELREIQHFKCTTLQLYLTVLDARSCWATLINALRILMETTDDRLFVICNNGITLLFQAFHSLHLMYHEATACHVTGEMVELLATTLDLLKCARACHNNSDVHQWLSSWKERADTIHKLLTLLNSYTPPEVRLICIDVLQELVLLSPEDTMSLVVSLLATCHASFQQNNSPVPLGPFFPHQGQKILTTKSSLRPQRPMLQMFLHPSQLEVAKGVDDLYDHSLLDFFTPYHQFVHMLCRLAVRHDMVNMEVVNLSIMLAIEGLPLHISIFPKLWLEIYHSDAQVGHEFLQLLYNSSYLVDYVDAVLLDERPSLNNPVIYQFFSILLPKVSSQVINDQTMSLVMSLVTSLGTMLTVEEIDQQACKLNGDLLALVLIFSVEKPPSLPEDFLKVIRKLIESSQMSKTSECTNQETASKAEILETSEPSTSALSDSSAEAAAAKEKSETQPIAGPCEALQWAEILRKSAHALIVLLEPSIS